MTSISLQGGAGLPGVRGDPVRIAGFTALHQILQCDTVYCGVMQCDAVYCGVMQCDVVYCDVMQCNAV